MNNKIIKCMLFFLLTLVVLFSCGCLNYQNRWTGGLGLTLAQVEDGVVIKDIAPQFESKSEALLPGDLILQVDGADVSALPKDAITESISGPVGALVSVTVLRADEIITFEIERIMLKHAEKKILHSKKMKTASTAEFSGEKASGKNARTDATESVSTSASADETNQPKDVADDVTPEDAVDAPAATEVSEANEDTPDTTANDQSDFADEDDAASPVDTDSSPSTQL